MYETGTPTKPGVDEAWGLRDEVMVKFAEMLLREGRREAFPLETTVGDVVRKAYQYADAVVAQRGVQMAGCLAMLCWCRGFEDEVTVTAPPRDWTDPA